MVRERVAAAGRTRLPLGARIHAVRAAGHALYTQAGPVSIIITLRVLLISHLKPLQK